MNEHELVRSIQMHDNRSAFTWLVQRYQSPLRSYLRKLIMNQSIADELAQETFLKAYQGILKFEHRSKFSTWIFQIARNTALDWLKSPSQNKEAPQLIDDKSCTSDSSTRIDLEKAFATIDLQLREILVLSYVDEFSHAEISEIINLPVGTVKTKLLHAKKQIQIALGEKAYGH